MERNFERSKLFCLDTPLHQIQTSELTQQLPLPDGMPDIGQILCAWGQVIARGKEWMGDRVSFSGGLMVWVLYAPEDGGAEQCIDTWIPFQMKWDLPDGTPEGTIRIRCLPRFVDGRSVSARKIMIRAGVTAMAEAFCSMEREVFQPREDVEDLELLQSVYPIRLPREAGEKTFLLDEELTLPDTLPAMEKPIYFRFEPKITDKKVMANKVVFRGSGDLHLLYRGEDGALHSWDYAQPFSQFAELAGEYGGDAQADITPMVTSLELEPQEDGTLRFKAGVVAQHLVSDREMLAIVEDAYSPTRELGIQHQDLALPALLETRRENLYGEQTIPAQAGEVADINFLPDMPRQSREDLGVELTMPGVFQILYYGEDGVLRSGTARWEQRMALNADENSSITAMPLSPEPQAIAGNGQILAKAEVPMELTTTAEQKLPMVTGVTLAEPRAMDPARPTLILRRAGERRLWDIAKETGSTRSAIRSANNLESEPSPDQMLLIPVW